MSTLTTALPRAASALSLTGATVLRVPNMIQEARRVQRAKRAIAALDQRLVEDVVVSRAHAMKAIERQTR